MRNGLVVFFAAMLGLAVLRIALGFVAVPTGMLVPAGLLVTAIFIAVPVFAIFRAGSYAWTPTLAAQFIVFGLIAHFGGGFLSKAMGDGLLASIIYAISQTGFFVWCIGLGALLATLLKDKNLLLPVSIFLAGFDIFSVLTPVGPTQQLMKNAPNLLPAVAMNIPKVVSAPKVGPVGAFAYIGPADFLFMGMFFIALFRFQMRTKETMKWLIPAILVYLMLALFFGAIPLLVPIGITVLVVNWSEFKLNRDEKLSTAVLGLLVIGLIAFGATRPRPPVAPELPENGQSAPVSVDSPAPTPEGQLPSGPPNAPAGKPNPR